MWFDTLSPDAKDRVRAVARDLMRRRDAWERQYDQLRPPPGTIPVGGAHMEPYAHSQALWEFSSGIARGLAPDVAGAAAKNLAAAILKSWNQSRRDYHVHKWPQSCDAAIDHAVRLTIQAAEEPLCRSEATPSKPCSTPTTSAP